jgi:hypothetical protein
MRQAYGVLVLGLAMTGVAGAAAAQVQVGVGWDRHGLDHLHVALGHVYGEPIGVVPSYIYPDELPVVYLLAREARVSPEIVMALREQGWSWLDIAYHLRVDPYAFVHHLPYDHGYWGWRRGRDYRYLTDRHIIDYVNVAFWAGYHRRPITQIIVIRQRIPTWNYYVVYHAPRIVYRSAPPRYDRPPRRGDRDDAPVRRAQPRGGESERGAAARPPERSAQRVTVPSRTGERATPPSEQRTRPTAQQATRPPTQATRPAAAPSRPATQPSRTPAQATRPAAQPSRPAAQPSRPAAQPSRPAAQQSRPAAQPSRPAAQPSRPAAQPSRPAARTSRPAAQPSRPAAQPSRPATQRAPRSNTREAASSSRRDSGSSASASRANRRGG